MLEPYTAVLVDGNFPKTVSEEYISIQEEYDGEIPPIEAISPILKILFDQAYGNESMFIRGVFEFGDSIIKIHISRYPDLEDPIIEFSMGPDNFTTYIYKGEIGGNWLKSVYFEGISHPERKRDMFLLQMQIVQAMANGSGKVLLQAFYLETDCIEILKLSRDHGYHDLLGFTGVKSAIFLPEVECED